MLECRRHLRSTALATLAIMLAACSTPGARENPKTAKALEEVARRDFVPAAQPKPAPARAEAELTPQGAPAPAPVLPPPAELSDRAPEQDVQKDLQPSAASVTSAREARAQARMRRNTSMSARPAREAAPKHASSIDELLQGSLGMAGHGYGSAASGAAGVGRSSSIAPAAPIAKRTVTAPVANSTPYAASTGESNTERYSHSADNPFEPVAMAPLSTFAIDVDTASYANVRRFLRGGVRPPIDAVRIEELVNYFHYDYPTPDDDAPVAVSAEVSRAPWNEAHMLVRLGLRTRELEHSDAPPSNLVFLIDVSGSMQSEDKLPLLKRGLAMLAARLRPQDRVAMVVYAGASGLVLSPTGGDERARVIEALERLEAGGSTNGGDGIRLAYQVARDSFMQGGNNRVVLATDGDFNVGTTSEGELVRLIEDEKKSGVFLTVLGFGDGNLNDSGMEALADHGNGNYAYIDSIAEAHKVLVREAGSTLVTVAKDAKLQIEWNPARVASYRLIGFENRRLAARDFNDDAKDGGEIGAGHTVTALYEVVPVGAELPATGVDPLRYQHERTPTDAAGSAELLTVKLRYKAPHGEQSRLFTHVVRDAVMPFADTSSDFRWACSVAAFGMLLRDSEHMGRTTLAMVKQLASASVGADPSGERHELLGMLAAASELGIGKQARASQAAAPRAVQVAQGKRL